MNEQALVAKVWNYAHVLRDDGVSFESERFRRFAYDDLIRRDKLNLDITWLKDAGATDPDSLPPPAKIAAEIVVNLESALERFRTVAAELG